MSGDQNKTEKPTPFKLREAKKKGQVAKSQEFNTFFGAVVFFLVSLTFVDSIKSGVEAFFIKLFAVAVHFEISIFNLMRLFNDTSEMIFAIFLPVFFALLVFGVATNILQTGFVFSTEILKPDFKKLNPVQGFKKLFARKSLFDLFKNFLRLFVAYGVLWLIYPWFLDDALAQIYRSPSQIDELWQGLFFRLGLCVILIAIPFALMDFLFTRWDFTKKMMMSTREVKDEHKKREGDPLVKNKQKQIQQELLKKSQALNSVGESDVIITNPTHIAVALKYNRKTMLAPEVVISGTDNFALKIRQAARKAGVPIIQNKTLARKLFKVTEIGGAVPASCFEDIAPVFRWLYGMNQERLTK